MRFHTLSLATLGLAASLAFAAFSSSPRAQEMPASQRKTIEDIVRDYLIKNPEVIREALEELEKRQRDSEKLAQKKALDEQKTAVFEDPAANVVGNPEGDVTLVEFFDYNCGFCKRSISDVQALIKADPKLRVVLRDFPILGPDSVEASKIALAAKNQLKGEKLWEYHSKLMNSRGRVGKDRALEVAKELGLDLAKLKTDSEGPAVTGTLQKTMVVADSLGLSGTPAFIVGDEIVPGAVGVDALSKLTTAVRRCGKAAC